MVDSFRLVQLSFLVTIPLDEEVDDEEFPLMIHAESPRRVEEEE